MHGQNVIVAGDVAAARKLIGGLGEASGHSIRSLQDAHSWFCDSLKKKNERGDMLARLKVKCRKKKERSQFNMVSSQTHWHQEYGKTNLPVGVLFNTCKSYTAA